MVHIVYSEGVEQYLDTLDKKIRERIVRKLDFFITTPNPLRFAKKLTDSSIGQYRFRVGDYRILFDCNKNNGITILFILKIGHRKDIYTRI